MPLSTHIVSNVCVLVLWGWGVVQSLAPRTGTQRLDSEAQSSGVMDSKNTDICAGNGEKRIEAMQRRYSGVFETPEPRSFGNGDDPHGVEEVDIGNLPRKLRAVCRIERLSKPSSVWLCWIPELTHRITFSRRTLRSSCMAFSRTHCFQKSMQRTR